MDNIGRSVQKLQARIEADPTTDPEIKQLVSDLGLHCL
jgi:hypothetical protein